MLDLGQLESSVLPHLRPIRPLSNISITGGEPTLHPHLGEFCRRLADYADTLTLVTSTTKLGDHFQDVRSTVTAYLISVDGVDPKTYKRARGIDLADSVLNWLQRLREEAPRAQIAASCVIQTANHADLTEIVDGCLARGAHHVFLRCPSLSPTAFAHGDGLMARTVRAASLSPEQLELVRHQLDDLTDRYSDQELPNVGEYPSLLATLAGDSPGTGAACDVPFTSFVISARGQFLPCFFLPQSASCDDADEVSSVRREVQQRVLHDPSFRAAHCDRCHQFTGRRLPVNLAVRSYGRQHTALKVAERLGGMVRPAP